MNQWKVVAEGLKEERDAAIAGWRQCESKLDATRAHNTKLAACLREIELPSTNGSAAEFYQRFYTWLDRANKLLAALDKEKT